MILPLQNLVFIVILCVLSSDGVHTKTHCRPGRCIATIFKVAFLVDSMHHSIVPFLHACHMIESEPVNSYTVYLFHKFLSL